MSARQKTRVALVGAGYVSTHHAAAIRKLKDVEVVAVADLDFPRALDLAKRFHIRGVGRTLADVTDSSPEVVHVLTPPSSHAEVTIDALSRGCHVLVEKPMAETAADCDRMIAAAQRSGRILSVSHSAPMDPTVAQALKLVEDGAIGEILAVDFFRSSEYPPYHGGPDMPACYRTGAYPFQDLGIHGLSLFEAFLGNLQDLEVQFESSGKDVNLRFDEWRVLAHCQRGIGQMYLSWNVRPMQNYLVVQGTRGVLHVDRMVQVCTRRGLLPGPKFASMVLGALGSSLDILVRVPVNVLRFVTGRLPRSPGIHVSVQSFYKALRQGSPVPIPAEAGRRMVAFMEKPCTRANQEREHWRKALVETALSPARVLVTGAGGLLGCALTRRLLQEEESLRAHFHRPPTKNIDPRIQVACGDLGDPQVADHVVRGAEVVYHVAAATKGNVADYERGTIWGTRNVVDACLRHGVKRLVYVSSLSVLHQASQRSGQNLDESWPHEPHPEKRGAYTQTKLQAEQIVLQAVREQKLPAVILRPGVIFGPGTSEVPSGVIGLAGRWIVVGDGSLSLPLVYVDDMAEALLLAGKSSRVVPGEIFHIADKTFVTQKQYMEECRKVLPHIKVSYVPQCLMRSMGLACEALAKVLHRSLPISRYRVRSIRPPSDVDVSAAERKLGWRPVVGVNEGLHRTFRAVSEPMAAKAHSG